MLDTQKARSRDFRDGKDWPIEVQGKLRIPWQVLDLNI
jgi:hypothetical protein